MHPSGCVSPRQGPKNWDISHQIALFQKFGPFRQPWCHSIFCYRIFLDLSLPESQSTRSQLHLDSFSSRSDHRVARYSRFCEITFGKGACPIHCNLPRCCAIKYCCSTEKAISVSTSHMVFSRMANAPFRACDPQQGRTSRFQNHNLHILNTIWTACHQDLTTGLRDIQDFVKTNWKIRMPFWLQFAPLLC